MRIHLAVSFVALLWLAAGTCQGRLVKTPGQPALADELAAPGYAPQSIGPLGLPAAAAPPRSSGFNAPPVSTALQQGLAYLHGLDRQPDLSLAGKIMMKAWMQGDKYAAAGVALCHASGCYGAPDARSVQLWIERTRRVSPAKAKLLEWHWAQLAAQGNPQTGTTAKAQRLLQEAAALGDPVALNERALQAISESRLQQAATLLERARLRGSPAAVYNLGKLNQTQSQPTDNIGSAANVTGVVVNSRAPGQADYELALTYHRGNSVPVNITQAVAFYQKAAQQGHLAAQRMLALIFSRPSSQGTIDKVWFRQLAPPEGAGGAAFARAQTTVWFQSDSSALIDWLPAQQQMSGVARSFSAWPQ
jgi:TPR repeat protein